MLETDADDPFTACDEWVEAGLPFYASFAGNPYHFFLGATGNGNGRPAQLWRKSTNTRTGHISSAVAVKHRSKQGRVWVPLRRADGVWSVWSTLDRFELLATAVVPGTLLRMPFSDPCMLSISQMGLQSAATRGVGDRWGGGHAHMAM